MPSSPRRDDSRKWDDSRRSTAAAAAGVARKEDIVAVERLRKDGATYSAAVAAGGPGRWVHVSGQIAPEGTLAEQTSGCFDQIEAALGRLGGSLENVVRITGYLTSLDEYGEYSRVRGERFGAALPASAVVQVAGLLQGALVEVDAVAFIPDGTEG
jgi:2-iminobutanoate/2-iminopropanoate deaminase